VIVRIKRLIVHSLTQAQSKSA